MASTFKGLLPVLGLLTTTTVFSSWLSSSGSGLGGTYTVCSPTKQIYTVADPERVECIGVVDGRIAAVGEFNEIYPKTRAAQHASVLKIATQLPGHTLLSYIPFQNTLIKLLEKLTPGPKAIQLSPIEALYPGFTDAHAHVIHNGYMLQLPLTQTKSLEEVITTLEEYVKSHPEVESNKEKWIEGMGWDQTKWNGGEGADFPTANDLDKSPILRGRPISLSRIDVHAKWVSTRVLEIMSATGALPPASKDDEIEKDGGKIMRTDDGNATGIFMDKAMNLIPEPEWSDSQVQDYFDKSVGMALKYGLTSIHDAATDAKSIAFLPQGTLPLRMYLMANSPSTTYWGNDTTSFPRLYNYGKDERLNLRAVKLFTDGALGSWGAALLEPYSDNPSTKGIMQTRPEVLNEFVQKFWADGWQTNIHCIGDRANKAVLDVLEAVLGQEEHGEKMYEVERMRPRIEHAQIFESSDLDRIGRLGVIASVQPTHATSDMWYAETRLGSERIKYAYAYQTLLQHSPNKVLPLGSDFPVEGVNPLLGFYAAVARLSHSDSSLRGTSPHGPGGWYPAEKLTRRQALKGMTLDAAYAAFAENEVGSLEVGKKADFTVLDRDIMREDAAFNEILDAKVRATIVDGALMYGAL
ncbi:amidohydrolase family-domain-containing protein [Ephemerocybe angulata]|uniref:Amidohydrolase family-domain-containing protein n=1 Tax=Ephemerocybe angulata TaxID=980116 RepID=A0A8H6HYI4_9AGAR|nr:amidohydrolase family-domain-containing protein [Tulosesus angulatus]